MALHSKTGKGDVKWDPASNKNVFGNDTLTAGQRDLRAPEALGSSPPRFQKTCGAALERQMLLEPSPDAPKNLKRPRRFRVGRWLVASMILTLMAVATCVVLFQNGRQWQHKVSAISSELRQSNEKTSLLEETIKHDKAENDRLLAESKVENRSLAVLAEKSMEELKRCLRDLRQLQKDKEELASRYRQMLSRRQSFLGTALAAWLPQWTENKSAAQNTE